MTRLNINRRRLNSCTRPNSAREAFSTRVMENVCPKLRVPCSPKRDEINGSMQNSFGKKTGHRTKMSKILTGEQISAEKGLPESSNVVDLLVRYKYATINSIHLECSSFSTFN